MGDSVGKLRLEPGFRFHRFELTLDNSVSERILNCVRLEKEADHD
jgi:hypothetical protein